jgi:hypothetical protein
LFEQKGLQLLAKRSKVTRVVSGALDYFTYDQYFILKGDQFIKVKNKATFNKLLPDKQDRKKLKELTARSGLSLRTNRERAYIKITEHCFNLIRSKK